MNITLYNTGSDPNDTNKTLATIGTYDCTLKAPVDEENPEIRINGTALNANYAHIPEMGRFYWLTPITQNNAFVVYQGKSDPVMSFKAGILASPAVIAKNPWHFDLYLNDPDLPIESRKACAVIKFPNNHFNGNNNCFILTTIGG